MKLRAAFKSPTSNAFHAPPPSDPAPFCHRGGSVPLHPLSCQREPWEKRERERVRKRRGVFRGKSKKGMRHQRDQQHMVRPPSPFLKVAYKRPARQEVGGAGVKPSAKLCINSTFCANNDKVESQQDSCPHAIRGGSHRGAVGVEGGGCRRCLQYEALSRIFTSCADQEEERRS